MHTDVVVLSKFPEIFEGFRAAIDDDWNGGKIVVWDETLHATTAPNWRHVVRYLPFQIAANANLGWKTAIGDLIYCGDDVRLIQPRTCERLRELAYSDPKLGILAPRLNESQMAWESAVTAMPAIPFVCVFIKRELIDAIGYLDERFTGYGVEDIDYCYRVRKAGWTIGFANQIVIRHGVDGETWGSTFKKVNGETQMAREDAANWQRFAEKYGIANDRQKCWDLITRGL